MSDEQVALPQTGDLGAGSLQVSDEARPGFWRSLIGIIDRPRETLKVVYSSPRWIWVGPILLLLASLVALNLVSSPYSAELAQEQLRRQIQSMPEEQAALLADNMERFSSPLFVGLTASVTSVIGLFIALLASAGILYFGGLLVGAEIDFGPLFSMVAWMWMPFFFGNLVEAAFIYVRRGLIVNQGLSWLVSVGDQMKDAANLGYFALSFVQVFVLWHLVLVWAGMRGAGKLSGSKATFIVLFYAILALALRWIPVVVARIFTV